MGVDVPLTIRKGLDHVLIGEGITHAMDRAILPNLRGEEHGVHHFSKVIGDRDGLHFPLAAGPRARKGKIALLVWMKRETSEGLRVLAVGEVLKVPSGPRPDNSVKLFEFAREKFDAAFCCGCLKGLRWSEQLGRHSTWTRWWGQLEHQKGSREEVFGHNLVGRATYHPFQEQAPFRW